MQKPCLKGKGGIKAAVHKAQSAINKYKYFYKSDIKKYYASIDHDIILDILRNRIHDRTAEKVIRFLKLQVEGSLNQQL
jgi:RNA-directed DNA polymerase